MGWLQGTQGAGPGPFRPDGFFGYASQRTVNVGAGQIAAKWGGARGRHHKEWLAQGFGVWRKGRRPLGLVLLHEWKAGVRSNLRVKHPCANRATL